jgi:hypothetical protein
MADVEYKADKPLRTRRFKLLDVIITVIIVAIIVALAVTLMKQLSLKHEAAAARAVTDAMISDIQEQDAKHARSLGDRVFQQQNSVTSLAAQFKQVDAYTGKATAVSDRTTVTNDKSGQAVSVIYKYSGKKPFYIRVIVTKPKGAGSWQVVDLAGNVKESPLLNNKY